MSFASSSRSPVQWVLALSSIVAIGVGTIFGGAAGRGVSQILFPQRSSRGPTLDTDKVLAAMAIGMNQDLPLMVGDDVRFDRAVAGPGKQFTYAATLVHKKAADLNGDAVAATYLPRAKANICSKPTLKALMQKGVLFYHQFYGEDGVLVTEFAVNANDCGP